METNAIEQYVRSQAEWAEAQLRDAIVATDWSETDVLRVVTTVMTPPVDGMFEPPEQTIEVYRYSGTAPPLSEHAPSGPEEHVEARTITLPLLRRLAADHPEVADVLAEATGDSDDPDLAKFEVEHRPERERVFPDADFGSEDDE